MAEPGRGDRGPQGPPVGRDDLTSADPPAAKSPKAISAAQLDATAADAGTDCPERESLELLAAGASGLGDVAAHVDRCPICREVIRQLRDDNELLRDFVDANRTVLGAVAGDTAARRDESLEVVPGFRVDGEIHRGAQGVVYRAEQLSTRRWVALKTMLQGRFATTRQRARFDREVEVVASLRHPHIVTLFESGRTREGLAFFAMELVQGGPLSDALQRPERPATSELLRMFIKIADAIAYAHQRGVIHRDLKPGNILVDAQLEPHVLDFGLARTARGDDREDVLEATTAGEFLGTFAYAAPEQFRGNPDAIDVRTDVFALGIILYELLVGERPFRPPGDSFSIADLLIARLETEPRPPSSLRRDLDADLDVIVLTCLKARPEERYQSAQALKEDLERFLDGRPIHARPDSIAYVMRKWVRRHRLATGTAVGVLVLIVASAIGLGILWGIANRNWERAEKRLATFRETLQEINPETGRGASDMTALGFLDLVEESAEARATGDLAVAASLLNSVQGIRLAFRPRELREEPLQRALSVSRELAQSRGVSDAPEVAEALHNLGRYAIQTDNLPLAEARYGEAIGMYERLYGRDAPESARSLQHLASCLRRQKKLDEAEALYERTLAIQRTAHGEASEEVAALLNGKGFVRRERGDLEGALRLFEQATASIRASKGAEDFRVGSGLYNVGQTKRQLRRYEEAIVDLREAVRVLSERMGDRSTPTIDARRELARTLLESGGPADEAVGHAQAVVAAQVALEAPPERLADAFELVAMTQLAAHRPEEAISTWREAMQRAPAKAAAIEQRAKAALVSAGQESFVDRLKPDDVGASPSR